MTTPALAVDLDAEREGFQSREQCRERERMAKSCLSRLGWNASYQEIKDSAQERWGLDEEEARGVAGVAADLQAEATERRRHIPVEDYMAKKTDGAKLKRFLWELFDENPETTIPEAYSRMQKELGYDMKESSFETTYFYPTKKAWREAPAKSPASDPVEKTEEVEPELDDEEPKVEPVPFQRRIFLDSSPEDCFDATEQENGDWAIDLRIVADVAVMLEVREIAWREMFGV